MSTVPDASETYQAVEKSLASGTDKNQSSVKDNESKIEEKIPLVKPDFDVFSLTKLQETLQCEYENLDSSLIAAFICESFTHEESIDPQSSDCIDRVQSIKQSLDLLSQESTANSDISHLTNGKESLGLDENVTEESSLQFLIAAFPEFDAQTIGKSLAKQDNDLVMALDNLLMITNENLTESTLSEEFENSSELSQSSSHPSTISFLENEPVPCQPSARRRKFAKYSIQISPNLVPSSSLTKKGNSKGVQKSPKLTIDNDTDLSLQQNRWLRLTSVAEYVSSISLATEQGLMSFFHQNSDSPMLSALIDFLKSRFGDLDISPKEKDQAEEMVSLLKALCSVSSENINSNNNNSSISHFQAENNDHTISYKLALQCTGGDISDACDLIKFLDQMGNSENLDREIHQSFLQKLTKVPYNKSNSFKTAYQPSRPSKVNVLEEKAPPSNPQQNLEYYPISSVNSSDKSLDYEASSQWQYVPTKEERPKFPHAQSIPAILYDKNINPMAKLAHPKADPIYFNRRSTKAQDLVRDLNEQRAQNLRSAARLYTTKNGKAAGIACAIRAQSLRDKAYTLQLQCAREKVGQQFEKSGDSNIVDLHGFNIQIATSVVLEKLTEWRLRRPAYPQISSPLKFITGKGNHSAGGKSVLLPTLSKLLNNQEDLDVFVPENEGVIIAQFRPTKK